jgi:hypothetical protein
MMDAEPILDEDDATLDQTGAIAVDAMVLGVSAATLNE